ncbi:MAG TPA: hypothetical protein VJ870_18400 [Amycolatopsis sp.]|nr:hypothetical protein [Amycolatopsis sp.]
MRSKEEILATLDSNGRHQELPFMPEMLAFAGREMRVYKRADKTCDTITPSTKHRRLENTVHLAEARCDGSAHGGCQAACLLFFREGWLERTDGTPVAEAAVTPNEAALETLDADTTAEPAADGKPRYQCQATELLKASAPLSPYEPRQYVDDVRSGNERVPVVIRGLLFVLFNKYQRMSKKFPTRLRIRDGETYPFLRGRGPSPAPEPLRLEPGDLVEVRSKEEILATLNQENKNRGMLFDVEMLPYCGRQARVLRKVERIIDEQTGKMLKLRDCVVLEDVYCKSLYHRFCPRAIYPYWREAWLRRVPE